MDVLALFIFVITATVTPGPNNTMIMASGMNYGVRASLPHYFGICTGFPLMVIGVGLGVNLLFNRLPWLHHLIQWVSVLYLFFMAYRIATTDHISRTEGTSKPFTYLQAALFQWVNPKAWIMATTAVSIYSESSQVLYDSSIIALSFMLVAIPSVAMWLVFGRELGRFFKKPNHVRWFNITMAILLIWAINPAIIELYHLTRTLWQ